MTYENMEQLFAHIRAFEWDEQKREANFAIITSTSEMRYRRWTARHSSDDLIAEPKSDT